MYAARYGFFRYLRFVKSNVQQMSLETTNTPLPDSSPRATRPSQDAAAAGPRMELSAFLEYVRTGRPLDTPAIHRLMDDMADEARRVTFRLNAAYHPMDEVRALLSELFGRPVPASLRVFPPLYADFGKNIHVGENVFINACCQFQDHGGVYIGDGCQIGHGVVFATLNHPLARSERRHPPGPRRVGGLERCDPAGRQHRRRSRGGRRCGGHARRAARRRGGRRARPRHQDHRLTASRPSCRCVRP